MPDDSSADVLALAIRLNFLSRADANTLHELFERSGQPVLHAALQSGLLTAEKIDILETLMCPRDTIPGYEIVDLLGHGGMGIVYRARQIVLDRIVALKTILVSRMASRDSIARFEQEARTIAQLTHPNIVNAYDFGRHGGRLFLAMEFVDGLSAEAAVKRTGPYSETVVWGIVRQTAAGLAHAWSRRVVHRDIKPANLLLVQETDEFSLQPGVPRVRIADFGLAHLGDLMGADTRLTAENITVGSPQYMAPEQLHTSDVDFRADIYALGTTALHLMTGATPLNQLTLPQLITRKLAPESIAEDLQYRDRLSPATYSLLRWMTARQPEDRPPSYSALIAEIDRLQVTMTTSHRGSPDLNLPTATFNSISTNLGTPVPTGERTAINAADDQPTVIVAVPQTERALAAVSEAPAQTAALVSRSRRSPWWMLAVLLLIAGATTWFAVGRSGTRVRGLAAGHPGVPQRVATQSGGLSTPLFNGINIANFTPVSGNWVVPPDEAVIAGTDGSIAGYLVRRNQTPINSYKLEAIVDPRDAKGAWIEFAICGIEPDKPACWSVRIAADRAELLHRVSPASPWEPPDVSMPLGKKQKQIVAIERNPAGWYVSVGETLLGFVPLAELPEQPEFRLGAEGGPAWFSDLLVTELTPTTP